MANCAQQITWHLKKDALEAMLAAAAGNYDALEFKMCITDTAQTKYFMRLLDIDLNAYNVCEGAIRQLGEEEEVCPVPPDCNTNPARFKSVLENYYESNQITFTIDKDTFIAAFG